MMFAAGLAVGALCGICIMCIVTHRREQEYTALVEAIERRNQKGAQNNIE